MSDDPTGSEASARAEIEDLLTQLSDADTQLTAPPTDLWNRIEQATTGDAVNSDDSVDRIGAQLAEADLPAGVISLDQRRRPKALAFLAAAAAIVAV
ncbi:MAG: hypothetical protein ACKVKO_03070, partial [Acidimicrobiales bacterium]